MQTVSRRLVVVGLVLVVAFSGCVTGEGSAVDVSASPADETGSIRGLVISEEVFPVPSAPVEVDGVVAAQTDSAGRFEVGGLPPGERILRINATGYEPHEQAVDVVAAGVQEIIVSLKGIPGKAPYVSTIIYDGYDICSFAVVYSAGWFTNECQLGERKGRLEVEVGPDWRAGVHEMTWRSQDQMALASSLEWECGFDGVEYSKCPAAMAGKAPLRIIARPLDAAYAKRHAIDGKMMWPEGNYTSRVFESYAGYFRSEINGTAYPVCAEINNAVKFPREWGCPFGVGVSTGIRFQFFHTTFYLAAPANLEEFSAIPDQ